MTNKCLEFIILFVKKPISSYQQNFLVDFLKGLLGQNITSEINDKEIIVYFNRDEEIDFNEIVNVINNELFIDVVLFEGKTTSDDVVDYINFIKNSYYSLAITNFYLSERELIKLSAKVDNEQISRSILKKYYDDNEMLNIVKVFIECNLNTSQAASKLYLHRNTLIGKIDKFINETGYDIKSFSDAYIVYHILK